MKKFLASWKGVLIMTLVLTTIRLAVPNLVTKNSTENDIVKVSDEKKTGYELQPGYVKITASWAKAYKDAKENPFHNGVSIISLLACLLGPFIWYKWADGKDGKGIAIWGSLVALALACLIPHYIVPSINKNSDAYTKKICLKEFIEGKNYDYMFPETDEQKISLEAFENSCR
jgi:hypothetical protein